MFVARYKHRIPSSREIASRFIAILVAVSFFAMWVPITSASRDKSGVMACCIGKEAGHCHAKLIRHRPPKPEPMCGLTSATLDAITIVAKPSTQSHTSRHSAESQAGAETKADTESKAGVESASLNRPCPMNCGICTGSTSRLQKRQKDAIQARTFHSSAFGAITRFENLSRAFVSNESWTNINPRGPPVTPFSYL